MYNKLVVTSEFRFKTCLHGFVWTDGQYDNEFWQRYLDVFSEVEIVARSLQVKEAEASWKRVDCNRIKLISIPHYIGPIDMLTKVVNIRRVLKKVSQKNAAFILRVPSIIGILLSKELSRSSKVYAVEVVGDPIDVFSKTSSKHPLRAFLKWYFVKKLQIQTSTAIAAAYVTKSTLQKNYPPKVGAFSTYYSSIKLPEYFFEFPIKRGLSNKVKRLLFIGSLEQRYKGLHVLLDALALYKAEGGCFTLEIIGDGRERINYVEYAKKLGLFGNVSFIGSISTMRSIGDYFSNSELFVLPSLTEGLPRVVIEAMACGVPCIATKVGGIPELLPESCLVEPGNAEQLANKIKDFFLEPAASFPQLELNRATVEEYKTPELKERRNNFYNYLKKNSDLY
jgi:glycosyltransferase involved in cell wall biosynthesis